MNIIVNADKNWGIGYKNKLLVRIPQDMKYFRRMTSGKVVVMGRKTLDSFPEGEPLKERVNIVLSSKKREEKENLIYVTSMEELMDRLSAYPQEDIFVIGGGSVYRMLLPYCEKAYVTKVNYRYEADTYFPDLDKDPSWQMTGISDEETYFDLDYVFAVYERKQ